MKDNIKIIIVWIFCLIANIIGALYLMINYSSPMYILIILPIEVFVFYTGIKDIRSNLNIINVANV